jgi:hypothetical protein
VSDQKNSAAVKISEGVRETINQDGAVLLDVEQGLCFSLNRIGAKIWKMAKDGHSLNEITDALENEFRLPRAELVADISCFFKRLEEMRLIGEQSSISKRCGLLTRFRRPRRSA